VRAAGRGRYRPHPWSPTPRVRAAIERHRDLAADYFAWRIAAGDLTGIDGPEGNEQGLEDERRAFSPS
jgi:hypothetical protein